MNYKQLRMTGLNNVRKNWKLSIAAAAMVWFLAGIMNTFLPDLDVSYTREVAKPMYEWMDGLKYIISTSPNSHITIGPEFTISLLHFILGGVVEMGYCVFLLKQHDGKEYQFNDIFSMFDHFGTGFAQRFLRNLYTTLWSLLLIIPGIVASLSYAMTPYILAENPDLTASQAISRSKEMMDGHKAELFMLHLTFLGWELLAALTLNIGYLWLNPYKNAADAAFYRNIKQQEPYLLNE